MCARDRLSIILDRLSIFDILTESVKPCWQFNFSVITGKWMRSEAKFCVSNPVANGNLRIFVYNHITQLGWYISIIIPNGLFHINPAPMIFRSDLMRMFVRFNNTSSTRAGILLLYKTRRMVINGSAYFHSGD